MSTFYIAIIGPGLILEQSVLLESERVSLFVDLLYCDWSRTYFGTERSAREREREREREKRCIQLGFNTLNNTTPRKLHL